MRYFLCQNTFMLYISIVFFIHIGPVTMQTITVKIEDIESIISATLDRVLGEIDPTIDKFQNATIKILSILENRIKVNISETLYWLETNLFVLLFVVIVFFISIFILLTLMDILLLRYQCSLEKRRFFGLAVITLIFFWIFIAMVLSTWPPMGKFDLQTFKYVLVGLLIFIVLYLIIVWISYLYTHRTDIYGYFKSRCDGGAGDKLIVRGPVLNIQDYAELEMF